MSKVAHIFPAFVIKYTGHEEKILSDAGFSLNKVLEDSSGIINIDLTEFDINSNNFLKDELKNQFMSYIFSCAYSDILYKKGLNADIVSGFSMGIYAALYHAKSIDFNTGLLLIKDVFKCVKDLLQGQKYAMASVIGFRKEELFTLAREYTSIEIVIQNGAYSFVIVGNSAEISSALEDFKEEGAIHLSKFEVSYPYHSGVLANHTEKFRSITDKYKFMPSSLSIMSMIDQRIINTAPKIAEEIVKNVTSPLQFFQTLYTLETAGFRDIIETGPGDSLLKSSKFIEGKFTFKAISKGKYLL